MPNPIVDPGFELNDTAWSFLDAAQRRDDLGAHGGTWAAYLYGQRDDFLGNLGSVVPQSGIPVTPGEVRVLTFWYRAPSPGPTTLRATVDPASGLPIEVIPPPAGDWTLFVGDALEMAGTSATVFFDVAVPGVLGSGYWQVDDVALFLESELSPEALVNRGKWIAYSALVNVLRNINGEAGGYYHDLTQRVRTAWQTPDESGDQLFDPYLCLPFDGDSEQITVHGARLYTAVWRQRIYGYVHETSSEAAESSAIEAVCNLRDDILRALMEDYTLGGQVRASRIGSIETTAGLGMGYGTVTVEIVFEESFTRDQLGPLGQ